MYKYRKCEELAFLGYMRLSCDSNVIIILKMVVQVVLQ